jgi:arsenate reductase (glutaredoxin)
MTVTIYHNPDCGTSRNTLAMIRNAGIEPTVIEYLKTPPSRATLVDLIGRSGLGVRDVMRQRARRMRTWGWTDPLVSDDQLIDAMLEHPILINRPLVVTDHGVRLCRPSEVILDILPEARSVPFVKEDGEVVVDEHGHRVK